MKKRIMTAKEVATFLDVTDVTIYRLVNSGKLPGTRIGNQWRFDMAKIEALFDEGNLTEYSKKHGKKKRTLV